MGTLTDSLNSLGISAFGISMPVLARSWTPGNPNVQKDDSTLSLTIANGNWLTPAPGVLRKCAASALPVTLMKPDGTPLTDQGLLLTLLPPVYLRLARLYARVLENTDQGKPIRPVPRYFYYTGTVSGDPESGVKPGSDTHVPGGKLTSYDDNGMPIDPLAVAAAFKAIAAAHESLKADGQGDFGPLSDLASLVGNDKIRLHVSDHGGQPYVDSHIQGITAVQANVGLYNLNQDAQNIVKLEAASGGFTAEDRRLLVLGPATSGALSDSYTLPAAKVLNLERDYFSLRVVQLKQFLLGDNSAFPTTSGGTSKSLEQQPVVRTGEKLTLLADGNDVLGAAGAAFGGNPAESLCVAQATDGTFNVPTAVGEDAHWPKFPAQVGTPGTGKLPVDLISKQPNNPTAAWVTAKNDVVLTLKGLPVAATVRVYPRKFISDAREARGDGAGGIVPDGGTLVLLLKDPLGLGNQPHSDGMTLSCDVMVVERDSNSRLYGNISAPIKTEVAAPTSNATNPFSSATHKSICNAGVLGLGTSKLSLIELTTDKPAKIILKLADDSKRDAPRWPTMARRELLVAANPGGTWKAVLAGGRLAPEIHSALSRLGAPGGLGGRETQVVGVATDGGRLAYDVARMAFRRAANLVDRMTALATGSPWAVPAQASGGSFAGAVLQTIAPFCETPELADSALQVAESANGIDPKTTFKDLADWTAAGVKKLQNNNDFPLRQQIIDKMTALSRSDGSLDQDTKDRLFDELRRELVSSNFGRRDAQWALAAAIARARNFIYIETPGFAATQGEAGKAYAKDLIDALDQRQKQAPGLRVILCIPKYPDFAAGYEGMAVYESTDRRKILVGTGNAPALLSFAANPGDPRVVVFHPIGFPGRPGRLESTVVIVDDVWALIGSCTFRRRGLCFDGGTDLVFTDTALENGCCKEIMHFRRRLMASRLGIEPGGKDQFGTMPEPNYVRLRDGREAFDVVRELLLVSGLGKIERLWNGSSPGVVPPLELQLDIANPEGQEFADSLRFKTAITEFDSDGGRIL